MLGLFVPLISQHSCPSGGAKRSRSFGGRPLDQGSENPYKSQSDRVIAASKASTDTVAIVVKLSAMP